MTTSLKIALTAAIAAQLVKTMTIDQKEFYNSLDDEERTEYLNELNDRRQHALDQQNALINAGTTPVPSLIECPLHTLDKLDKLAPQSGYQARKLLASTLGFYVVNALSYQHRRTNGVKTQYTSDLDWLNASLDHRASVMNEDAEAKLNAEHFAETGITSLPLVDGTKFIGPFKGLVLDLMRNPVGNTDTHKPDPKEIFNQQNGTRDIDAERKAYDDMLVTAADRTDAARLIRDRLELQKKNFETVNKQRRQAELDYVLGEIRTTPAVDLDDAHWGQLPLYVQYKMVRNILSRCIDAFAKEMTKEVADRRNEHDMLELINDVRGELANVINHPEIKLAFELDKLDATKHSI